MCEAVGRRNACYYFVDETGDGALFDKHKRVIVGREGCSKFFALGALESHHPKHLHDSLESLRADLLADPYLASVPSMQADSGKTAKAFHAKNDCPEVRREVFKLLMQHDLRFFAVLRDKRVIAEIVRKHHTRTPTYRYRQNQLYDRCVSQLFKERLHKEDSYVIQFSRRGSRDRTESLSKAIQQARNNFRRQWGIEAISPIEVAPSDPDQAGGLQAVDYFLWALQRLYVKGEERYWSFIADKVSLVLDYDDTGTSKSGTYYTRKNPLTRAKLLEKREPGI